MKTSKHKCRENVNEKISNNKSRKKCQRRKSRKINVEEKKGTNFILFNKEKHRYIDGENQPEREVIN
jgi:hypothetical protein